jgi:SNF2 family DNA or RNA helicase
MYGMTGTPIERDWEDAFSELRIVTPGMPTVAEFEKRMVRFRDDYQKPHWNPKGIPWFTGLCGPWLIRKRKTDKDVRDQFPEKTEEIHRIELPDAQMQFYRQVRDLSRDENNEYVDHPGMWTVLRQIAGHPASVIYGRSRLAQMLAGTFGPEYVMTLPSGKTDRLLSDLELIVHGQGARALVFTVFGQSVLPVLAAALHDFAVFTVHGGMTGKAQDDVRQAFRNWDDPCVLLSSDAGSRGVNLPEASYVIEYEGAVTHSLHAQRTDRAHRIGHGGTILTCSEYLATGTVEEGIARTRADRAGVQETFLGDEPGEGYDDRGGETAETVE